MNAADDGARSDFAWPAGKRAAVSLSFDDARPSQIDRGMGVLNACGARATFYVSMEHLARRADGWGQAVEAGHEIGNHTLNHPCSGNFPFARGKALEDYTLERMEADLLEANEVVRRRLGVTPTTFAYPCGQKFVGRGEGVCSYVPLVARHFVVGRDAFCEIWNDPAFCDLAQATSMDGDGRSFEQLRAMVGAAADAGGWLILMGHEIGDGPAHQTTHADALAALCRYVLDDAGGIWLDTVAAVGTYIREARRTASKQGETA
jgi:peptidoglycan/xylan/chitin deacetylase (PgdA/CDA1 family)